MRPISGLKCEAISWSKLLLLTAILTLVVTAAVPGMLVADEASHRNAITNGGFEADANGDQWPDDWPRGKAGTEWREEAGNRFLRLSATEPGTSVVVYRAVRFPDSCKALKLTWRWRVEELLPGEKPWFDARILLEFRDADGQKVTGAPAAPHLRKVTDGWVEQSLSFLVPADARSMEIMPSLLEVKRGIIDIDDMRLELVDPAPLEEQAKLVANAAREKQEIEAAKRRTKAAAQWEKSRNLISNGNFETAGKAGVWPEHWGSPKAEISWVKEELNHFLRLRVTEPGQTQMVHRNIDLPPGTKALELSWRQRISDLKPGKEPWYDARIMLEFKDLAGKKLNAPPSAPYTRSNTEGWVDRKVEFLVPEAALSLDLLPALLQVQRGTFDLDDLTLRPVAAEPLLARARQAEEEAKSAMVPKEEPKTSLWPKVLHVSGHRILDSRDQPVWLQGVNVVSLEWSVAGEKVLKSALVAIKDWNANTIRLPVKEEYWFGEGPGQKDGGAAYRQLVDEVITLAANRGAYVVLDLHRFRAPKPEHVRFWSDAAARYKNHPAVLFDLFNEPHGVSWDVWRDGGFVAEKSQAANADENTFLTPEERAKAQKGFQSPGMQALLNTVRKTGAKNIVIVGGLDWSYDLSGIANGYGLSDPDGNGIVYSTHIYPWKRDWAGKVLCVAEKHPIFVGEVGADLRKMTFIPADAQEDAETWTPEMLGLIQKHKLHWTGFSFHPKASPVMITGWDYTPTAYWGQLAKDALSGKPFELKRLR
ncbi:MAG: glycoside hydrolase family 5 [Planctomyces sp.]|nr:glycoside hydrolase family 5 [Planctomyces sp.]